MNYCWYSGSSGVYFCAKLVCNYASLNTNCWVLVLIRFYMLWIPQRPIIYSQVIVRVRVLVVVMRIDPETRGHIYGQIREKEWDDVSKRLSAWRQKRRPHRMKDDGAILCWTTWLSAKARISSIGFLHFFSEEIELWTGHCWMFSFTNSHCN